MEFPTLLNYEISDRSEVLCGEHSERRDFGIEWMEKGDIEEVLGIEQRCFISPWTRDSFEQELDLERSKSFVAKKTAGGQKRIIGYIFFWLVVDEIHILNIATHPDFRKQGIATSLVDACLEFSNDACAKAVTLEVRKSNLSALSLYKKFGFECKGVRPGYYSDTQEDAIVMWLKLGL